MKRLRDDEAARGVARDAWPLVTVLAASARSHELRQMRQKTITDGALADDPATRSLDARSPSGDRHR